MNNKRKARPVLMIFLAAFLSIIGILYVSVQWVDEARRNNKQIKVKTNSEKPALDSPD
ncbi:MAG: hypothetical protein VYC39_09285 [Myxococcota bacterium]|nr:hypothetical protein [Myxococcota bacterium]